MTPEPITVFIVDDHVMVRRGITAMFDQLDDITVVGEAADGRQAIVRLTALSESGARPDVVLMDLLMPGVDGIEATRNLRHDDPDLCVVAVSSFADDDMVRAAFAAGAVGYVRKDADVDELAAAVRAASRGHGYLDPNAAAHLTSTPNRPADQPFTLTDRENEILSLIAAGEPNQRIAHRLTISERTVRTHVSNILAKLGVESRTQAALWAVREGLADPS